MAKFGKKSTLVAASGAMHARKEGGVGWMTYDQQAKFNAVTYDMRSAIPRIMQDFESDTEDLDDLADEIFDALHDHTHKYLHEE